MIYIYCIGLYILIAIIVAIWEFKIEKEIYKLIPSAEKDLHITITHCIIFGLNWGGYVTINILYMTILICEDIAEMLL